MDAFAKTRYRAKTNGCAFVNFHPLGPSKFPLATLLNFLRFGPGELGLSFLID